MATTNDGDATLGYQWMSSPDNGANNDWTAITGATNSTYALTSDDVHHNIEVVVNVVDNGQTVDSVASSSTGQVAAPTLTLIPPTTVTSDANGTTVSGAGIQDSYANDIVTLDLTVRHGTLQPADTVDGALSNVQTQGDPITIEVTGSVSDINTLMNDGVHYTPIPSNPDDLLTVTVHDSCGASVTEDVTITNPSSTTWPMLRRRR